MKKKVNLCLIGAGRAGLIHARNFRRSIDNADLIAIADPNYEARSQVCKELDINKSYDDYRYALSDKEIDAVIVVAPTAYHCQITIEAAQAKKHIFCEKPMAMNEVECKKMIDACESNNVILQIGFMRRFDQSFQDAYKQIETGVIGDIVLIKSNTRGPSIPQKWTYDLKKSNGPLAEVNSHDIDSLRWFSKSEFSELYAIAGNYRCPDAKEQYPDYYDNVALIAKLKNDVQGMIDGAVSVEYGYDAKVEIVGTSGCIQIGDIKNRRISVIKKEGMIHPVQESWRHLYSDAYLAEDKHFVNCIINHDQPITSGYDGLRCVQVVNAGNQSIKENRVVNLNQ